MISYQENKYKGNIVMKKAVTKTDSWFDFYRYFGYSWGSNCPCDSYVVQDGDSFYAIATANGWIRMSWQL